MSKTLPMMLIRQVASASASMSATSTTATAAPAIPTTEAQIKAVFEPLGTAPLAYMFCQIIIDTFFAGILTMQVYSYFKYQKRDARWIKMVVIATAALNAGFTAYLWYFMQYLFVANFGLWAPFAKTTILAPGPFLDSINSGIVQGFFAYRAFRLCNRQWLIPIVCGMLILTSIGATLSVLIIFSSFESLFEAVGVSVPELIWLSSIMSADIIITVSILYGLIKSKTGWSHTDKVITRLIRMTLESQVPPCCVAITFMIEFVRTPSSLFGATMQGIQPKFYACGLMYALNARITFQQQWVGDTHQSGVFAMGNRPTQKTQLQVEVGTETFVQTSPAYVGTPGLNRTPYETIDDKKDFNSLDDPQADTGAYNSQAQLTDAK